MDGGVVLRFESTVTSGEVENLEGRPSQGEGGSIARDMNLHSAVVLQGPVALHQQQQQPRGSGAGPSSGVTQETPTAAEPLDSSAWQERGSIGLDDLRGDKRDEADVLHIRNPRRYFERGERQRVRTSTASGVRSSGDARTAPTACTRHKVASTLCTAMSA